MEFITKSYEGAEMNDGNYTFRDFYIPIHMMDGIRRYIDDHIPPGDFLSSIITNDLRESVGRADDENIRNIPAYVSYFYNEAPSSCWGSAEKMNEWLNPLPEPPK